LAIDYGAQRRRLRIVKMRGIEFKGGFHDFTIRKGGLRIYPRLVAAEHQIDFESGLVSMVYAISMELLAYHTALVMGTDVDQPRNLPKAVNVEQTCAPEPDLESCFVSREEIYRTNPINPACHTSAPARPASSPA
jgi:hypothetical protein